MTTLKINGTTVEAPAGTTVLRAAASAGITIPTLCDHPDLHPYGGCRLCLVEVKGARLPMTACTLPINEGMEVETETPKLVSSRRTILELLLSNYHDVDYNPERHGVSELEHWVEFYGLEIPAAMRPAPRYPVNSDPNPFVFVDLNKCILCTRCIRACAEVQGRFVWSQANRGYETHIVAGADTDMIDARCESCGACVAYCPTGALSNKLSHDAGPADRLVTTTCTYCGVGCQFDLNIQGEAPNDHIIRVTSNENAPVNGMALCVKGRYGYDFVHHPDRLTRPRVRRYLLDGTPRPEGRGEWVETDWDTALDITARKLREIRDTHGPDSIGVLTSAKCTNEENYLMNKFARQVVGTNNIDHCARL
jgi:formate dehydrogenase major subunit/formate dehydrogenase alpha subunit